MNKYFGSLKSKLIIYFYRCNNKFLKGLVKNKCKQIFWLDQLQPELIFLEAESSEIHEPNFDGLQNKLNVPKPRIALYNLSQAKLHCESSNILLEDAVVMERLPHVPVEYCNYSTGLIKYHDNKYATYKTPKKTVNVEKAFFLGGNGSYNYYHWTVELIAKLKYLLISNISTEDLKIVVPEHVKNINSFYVMLDIFVGDRYELVYVPKNQVVNVKNLYLINSPSNLVFSPAKDVDFSNDFMYLDKGSLDFLRNTVLNSPQYISFLNQNDNKCIYKNIFIARKNNITRNYNQTDVISLVSKYGFKTIFMEDLSFFEQIYLFQNANCIIGASGAAWTNLVYVKKNSKAISWLGENIISFSGYSTLAKYNDSELIFLKCKVNDISNKESDYEVDLDILDRLLQSHECLTL